MKVIKMKFTSEEEETFACKKKVIHYRKTYCAAERMKASQSVNFKTFFDAFKVISTCNDQLKKLSTKQKKLLKIKNSFKTFLELKCKISDKQVSYCSMKSCRELKTNYERNCREYKKNENLLALFNERRAMAEAMLGFNTN